MCSGGQSADSESQQTVPSSVRGAVMLKWGLTSAGRGTGNTEKRSWANHEEEQLRQTLLWKQVAPKQSELSPDGGIFHSNLGTAG